MPTSDKSTRRAARRAKRTTNNTPKEPGIAAPHKFEFRSAGQRHAWSLMQKNEVSFLLGSAGSGKTFLAVAYALQEIVAGRRTKIILTRPIVEAGERLGYLPGTFGEKVNPYMQPLYDTIDLLAGRTGKLREEINKSLVLAPLCYMRGRTFTDAVCLFDEAQNATYTQLKLFLSRFGENTKVIITGDPAQSDLPHPDGVPLTNVMTRLADVPGIASFQFLNDEVVRHPLVSAILKKL